MEKVATLAAGIVWYLFVSVLAIAVIAATTLVIHDLSVFNSTYHALALAKPGMTEIFGGLVIVHVGVVNYVLTTTGLLIGIVGTIVIIELVEIVNKYIHIGGYHE